MIHVDMRYVFVLFGLLAICGAARAQAVDAALIVRNGDTVVASSAERLAGMPRRTIDARDERETTLTVQSAN